MSDKKEWLELCNGIVEVFRSNLQDIFQKEEDDDNYMKQTILGSKFRAFVAVWTCFLDTQKSMINILALAIAKHRVEVHEESSKEVEKLEEVVSDEESEVATRGFWRA